MHGSHFGLKHIAISYLAVTLASQLLPSTARQPLRPQSHRFGPRLYAQGTWQRTLSKKLSLLPCTLCHSALFFYLLRAWMLPREKSLFRNQNFCKKSLSEVHPQCWRMFLLLVPGLHYIHSRCWASHVQNCVWSCRSSGTRGNAFIQATRDCGRIQRCTSAATVPSQGQSPRTLCNPSQ